MCDDLAKGWIADTALQRPSPQGWAADRLADLLDHDPEGAWRALARIWRTDDSELILANLAAGPVEDLLAQRGRPIACVYLLARSNLACAGG